MRLIKKFFLVLFVFSLILGVNRVDASVESVENGEELAHIKRLAIAFPEYTKAYEKEPNIDEFINLIYEAGKVSRSYIISYDEVASRIKGDTGVDVKIIQKMTSPDSFKQRMEARKVFRDQIYKFADGYVVVTVANNSRVTLFFNVYAVNSNERVYSFQVSGSKEDYSKNGKAYKALAEQFFRAFDKAAQTEMKKNKD